MFKNSFLKNKMVRIILIAVCIAVVGVIAGLLFLHKIMSYPYILNKINNYTGLYIELIEPNTSVDGKLNLTFKSNEINVLNKEKTKTFIQIKNPNITFKPLNLIFKKANFKTLNAKSIKIDIKRDEAGNIDFINSLSKRKWDFIKNNKIDLAYLNSYINLIEFNFEDKYNLNSTTKLVLNDSKLFLSEKQKLLVLEQSGIIDTSLNSSVQRADIYVNIISRYPVNNFSTDNLDANVNIDNINLLVFNDLAKKYISKDIAYTKGSAQLRITALHSAANPILNLNVKINNPSITLKDKTVIAPYKNGIDIASSFKIQKNTLYLEKFNIKGNKLSVLSNGEVKKVFSKNPQFSVNTKITDTQLNNFLYFLPDNLIFYRPEGIPYLKKSNFHAILNGSINTLYSPLDITGSIKASNVHIPDYPKPYKQNDVNLIFMKDKLRVYTRVYTPDNQYVTVDGISDLDSSLKGKYSVQSTPNIDLKFAQMYLVPIAHIIGFNIGPVPIMELSGMGNIDIKTSGTPKDAQIFGQFQAHNASAKIAGLDAKLTQGNCKLIFDNRNLIFREIKGKMNGADFILTGTGNTAGEVDLNAKIKNTTTNNVLKILNNSIISKPYMPLTKNIAAVSGKINTDIKLSGTIENYEDEKFLQKLKLAGFFKLFNNKIVLNNGFSAKNINGTFNFGLKQNGDFETNLGNSKFKITFSSDTPLEKIAKGEVFDISTNVSSDRAEFEDIITQLKNMPLQKVIDAMSETNFLFKMNLKSNGKISVNNINFDNFQHSGFIIGLNSSDYPSVKFNSGIIKAQKHKLIFDNFNTSILGGKIDLRGNVDNFLSERPSFDLKLNLNDIKLQKFDKLVPKLKLSQAVVKNGQIIFKDDDIIKLNGLNLNVDNTPIFLNANLKNIYADTNINADFSALLSENGADSIINPILVYPLKIKGETPIKGTFKGTQEKYSVDFNVIIPKGADISFSGANLGDESYKREFAGRINVDGNIASFNNLHLIKYIMNQNNKINPIIVLKTNGQIAQKQNNLYFNNFKIATNSPLNVRILNLIFKKSLLKKGLFECNLVLNGAVKSPKSIGKIYLEDLDIPLYDTQIKDIKLNILDKYITGEILAKNKETDLRADFNADNSTTVPYTINKLNISSNRINIADILSMLASPVQKTDIEKKQDITAKPADIIVKEGSFDFKDVQYEKINAKNLKGNFKYNNEIFDMQDITFDIAEGKIQAEGTYSFKTTKLDILANMHECNSNILAKDFLHVSDQIFGQMDGTLKLSAKNLNTPTGIKNINSDIDFSINEGKMPKLGSMEYILRAGNLIKNGILGLSLNNIIQVLTPYKTGEFEKISGKLKIRSAKVENLEIESQGKNLSMYLIGKYNILDNFAEIKIYGKLSQNVSNALGAIGNASLSQFINSFTSNKTKNSTDEELQKILAKIPSIKIENPKPRYFSVKVLGNINKDNYIKHFRWE